ncbi:PREDICTED: C-X-C motif chemokine 6 [Condylura cristata]|uniref:C-X-C motif chemokine 6 n=1 Tax=Condylura cristata TaxID=143302 RepID=UPI0006433062|nr:PREDICTED: C-X-C motif chemokine 6 [Condylura cristata]
MNADKRDAEDLGEASALELQILGFLPPAQALPSFFSAMSLLPKHAVRFPHLWGSLSVLLALLLLMRSAPVASARPVATNLRELRCICLAITPGIHPKMISNLQVLVAGPQCPKLEVIASLKNKKETVCLDPNAPLIKRAIKKNLESGNKKN